jgi:beta-glucanase (GH16 family)
MNYQRRSFNNKTFICLFICLVYFSSLKAQDLQLVWSDEFNGSSLDQTIWSFQLGQFNDCVHYSTDLPTNTTVTDGKLQLIALEESYQGYDYTASVIKTKHTVNWRYGKIEARIKLPSTDGFVPAFWLLPEDEQYGWWPASGEIDIMEHPTNEVTTIYGTIHSEAYNSFTGSGPRGGTIDIADAETAFHLYAIEWTPEKIDFYVDNQNYYTFNNEHSGYQTWPFDHPFYVILNMAVGGAWVGNPTGSTVFPAIMEVDYIRVYQNFEDIALYGTDYVMPHTQSLLYSAPNISAMEYEWSVPNTAQITTGQNTKQINVDWGIFTGTIELFSTINSETRLIKYPVEMSNNLLKNSDFEKGAKYWNKSAYYPAEADFTISTQDVQSGARSLFIDVISPGVNPWDIQLSQTNLELKSGQTYQPSFWAKSETNSEITAAIINASNFYLYTSETFQLTSIWTQHDFTFTAPENAIGSFNIDMGGHTGNYHFDDFELNIPAAETDNQISNADFSAGDSLWIMNTYYPAVAQGNVIDGEYAVSITNGGNYPWDIHLGQAGFTIENGKEYNLSFDAYAFATREISPIVGKNSEPWTVYSNIENVLISPYRKTYSFYFIMNETSDTEARLGFDIGVSSEDVFIDNVFLSNGTIPINVDEKNNYSISSFQLFQNWPNPFNPSTIISWQSPVGSHQTIKVFDVLGNEIASLVDEYKPAGNYEVEFQSAVGNRQLASGVYFYQLKVVDPEISSGQVFIQTKKMLYIK